MATTDQNLARTLTAVSAATALLVAIAVPVTFFALTYHFQKSVMETQLRDTAQHVNALVTLRPGDWQWQSVQLQNATEKLPGSLGSDVMEVLDSTNRVVLKMTDSSVKPASPIIERLIPITRGTHVVAKIHGVLSLRPILLQSLAAALVGVLLGSFFLLVTRLWPMRALRTSLQQVSYLATHDVLTGLPNRRLFLERLGHAREQSGQLGETPAVLLLDIDHFKDVNDTSGHATGDRLLQQAANRMLGCLRRSDTLARLGGDEFACVVTGFTSAEQIGFLAQRLLQSLEKPFSCGTDDLSISASIGIAMLNPACDADTVLSQADLALYRAKSEGRNTFRHYEDGMNRALQQRKSLERQLRQAIAEDQFEVFYQPQMELATGALVGVEALLRWHHPSRGLIAPPEFIHVAEETGLILPLGRWVLQRACTEALPWQPLRLAVNLSPVQFRQTGLLATVAGILAETGFPAQRLELEITEGVLLHDTEATLCALHDLRALGIGLAMDDFGTGYSSLAYLQRFPFDKVKIDRCFVRELGHSDSAAEIVRAIIALSRSFCMCANAEGVETEDQFERLRREGCHEAQGYFFGHPMSAAQFTRQFAAQLRASRPTIAPLIVDAPPPFPANAGFVQPLPLRA